MRSLDQLPTPCLVLDRQRLERNLLRMRARIAGHGVALRPHAKTAKSYEILRLATAGQAGGITVSTLAEADYFLDRGLDDILYAVGIAPGKLAQAAGLVRRGARLTLVTDNVAAAAAAAATAVAERCRFDLMIELDVDGHRSGVAPGDPLLLRLAEVIAAAPGLRLAGVMTHAGESYRCRSIDEIRAMAERERAGAVAAAGRLRAAGHAAPVVSVGSTPTATFAESMAGVTEVRAGVYMLNDLVMAGLGVCAMDDIAASVLVSVIGHQHERGWIITDGGWLALSRDAGTADQPTDQRFGVMRALDGGALADDLLVVATYQEHGVIAGRNGRGVDLGRYPVGTMFRVLPVHACATAAQHDRFNVVDGDSTLVVAEWPRVAGWCTPKGGSSRTPAVRSEGVR